jgi:tetratricopeptide (TPR) repeat protein
VVRLLPHFMAMRVGLLTFFAASALFAADEQQLALALKAQTDFDRVFLSAAPQLRDTNLCVQTQASMLPVAPAEELPLVHFRKGWCTLAGASITREAGAFQQAASEFDQAAAAWGGRNMALAKKRPAEPLPSMFPVLAAVARLNAGAAEVKDLAPAVTAHACPVSAVPVERCEAVLQLGKEWLGWLDLKRDDLDAAAREFPQAATAWTNWVAGKQAFRDRKYTEAATAYRRAVEAWDAQSHTTNPPLLERLAPRIDLSSANAELGGAQLLAGDAAGAIVTLNQAIRQDTANARALFLRARAKDVAGQTEAAIADYNLAARNALAKAGDQGSGDAHVYRGISLYRRKEYEKAEDEFTNALNFEIEPAVRADAVAWRRLAAVASGSCESGRKYLEEALPKASPFFPRDEARTLIAACTATTTAVRSEPVK